MAKFDGERRRDLRDAFLAKIAPEKHTGFQYYVRRRLVGNPGIKLITKERITVGDGAEKLIIPDKSQTREAKTQFLGTVEPKALIEGPVVQLRANCMGYKI